MMALLLASVSSTALAAAGGGDPIAKMTPVYSEATEVSGPLLTFSPTLEAGYYLIMILAQGDSSGGGNLITLEASTAKEEVHLADAYNASYECARVSWVWIEEGGEHSFSFGQESFFRAAFYVWKVTGADLFQIQISYSSDDPASYTFTPAERGALAFGYAQSSGSPAITGVNGVDFGPDNPEDDKLFGGASSNNLQGVEQTVGYDTGGGSANRTLSVLVTVPPRTPYADIGYFRTLAIAGVSRKTYANFTKQEVILGNIANGITSLMSTAYAIIETT